MFYREFVKGHILEKHIRTKKYLVSIGNNVASGGYANHNFEKIIEQLKVLAFFPQTGIRQCPLH